MSAGPQPSHLSTTVACTDFPWSKYWIYFHEGVSTIYNKNTHNVRQSIIAMTAILGMTTSLHTSQKSVNTALPMAYFSFSNASSASSSDDVLNVGEVGEHCKL